MSKTKILIIAALAVVSGGCSNPYKYMSVSEVEEEYGRMMRGYVKFVVPDDTYQEMLDAYGSDEAFAKVWAGANRKAFRKYQGVMVRYYRGLDGAKQISLWIPPEWGRLEQGDIVDFYNGKPAMTDGVAEKSIRTPIAVTVTAGLMWFVVDDMKNYPMKERAIILGIVCRAAEPGLRAQHFACHDHRLRPEAAERPRGLPGGRGRVRTANRAGKQALRRDVRPADLHHLQ